MKNKMKHVNVPFNKIQTLKFKTQAIVVLSNAVNPHGVTWSRSCAVIGGFLSN